MSRRLTLTCLLLLPLSASAIDYWVLGSYVNKENAISEQVRLAEMVGSPVSVLYSPRQDSYRVVVDASLITEQELIEKQVDAWFMPDITRPVEEAAVEPSPESKPAVVLEATPETEAEISVTITEPEWQPLYPPLLPGEDLIDYCQRLSDSPLCTDPDAKPLLDKARLLKSHRSNMLRPCAGIDNPKLKATCLEIQ